MDTSPTGIGWVVNQEGEDGTRFPIRFGAKVLSERQRGYAQVKRELWGIVSAVKVDKDYLIGAEVVIETDCLPILARPGHAQVDSIHQIPEPGYTTHLG